MGDTQLAVVKPRGTITPHNHQQQDPIMSWQDYINTMMIGKNLKMAAIAGHNGSIWAKSSDFNLQPAEVSNLVRNFDQTSHFAASGLNLAGQKYFFLSGDETVLRGKQGKGGVHVMKTNQTVLVGVYEEPMQPAEAATITESLGDYLVSATSWCRLLAGVGY